MTEVVATGAPRSGTHYLATLLRWNHEVAYRFDRHGPASTPEVSWAAAPHLDPTHTFVIHLVRHPVPCVSSNIHRHWLQPANDWGRYAHAHAGTWDPWAFWLYWTDLCDRIAHTTIRLEDIAHLGPATNRYGAPHPVSPPDRLLPDLCRVAARHGYAWEWDGSDLVGTW